MVLLAIPDAGLVIGLRPAIERMLAPRGEPIRLLADNFGRDLRRAIGSESLQAPGLDSPRGYYPIPPKIDRRRWWKSHRKPWHLTGAKASISGHAA